jgi:hypothetical protein
MASPQNILRADSLLRVAAGLLLGLLVWTGNKLVCRVECLENRVTQIMVRMGIEPQAHEKPGAWGLVRAATAKPMETKSEKFPDSPLTDSTPCH